MMNIVMCDDTPLQLRYTHQLVQRLCENRDTALYDFCSAQSLLAAVDGGLTPHIAILDIQLNGTSGIDLAREINSRTPDCQVIFLTAFAQYASEAYFASHTWFILKNEIDKYLPPALEKAFSCLEAHEENVPTLTVKIRRTVRRIPASDVLYLERIAYRTKLVTLEGEMVCSQSPNQLLEHSPDDLFIRCHQSYWVNAEKIFSQTGNEFHLIDGSVIPISRTYKKEAVAAFMRTSAQPS